MILYPGAVVTWHLVLTGDEDNPIELQPKEWALRRSREDLIQWSLVLPDRDTDALPSGPLASLLSCDPYDDAGNLRKWLRCAITLNPGEENEEIWTSPKLIHLDYEVRESPTEVVISISGNDPCEALLRQDQIMDDVRSTPSLTRYRHEVIAEILEEFGLDSYAFNFSNTPVSLLHRTGSPIEWIRELLEPVQGWFWWDEDTLKFEPGGTDISIVSGTPLELVKILQFKRSAANVNNAATFERSVESRTGVVEPVTGVAGSGSGYIITVPFETALNNARIRIELFGPGKAINGVFDDAGGSPLTVAPTFVYSGGTKAAQFRFTVEPKSGYTADIPYKVYVYGAEHVADFGSYEAEFEATYVDAADQALRGKRPRRAPLTNGTVANQATGLDFATRWVRESLRKYCTAKAECLLSLTFRPGMVALVNSVQLGLTSYKMLVESVEYRGDANSLLMDVELSRGYA